MRYVNTQIEFEVAFLDIKGKQREIHGAVQTADVSPSNVNLSSSEDVSPCVLTAKHNKTCWNSAIFNCPVKKA